MLRFLTVVVLSMSFTIGAAADSVTRAGQSFSAGISGSVVNVTGATPGGNVVFFGVARFVKQYRVTVRRFDKIKVADASGSTSVDIGEPIPWRTIFAAVDLSTGQFALVSPDGFPLIPIAPANEVFTGSAGQFDHLNIEHRVCEMLHVRPGTGAWGQVLADGNKFDDDASQDGKVSASPSKGVAIDGGSAPAPNRFANGDVVILIDPQKMQSYAVEVGHP